MLPISQDDLWSAWERVRENEGCAGADGVTVHAFAQRAQRALPELLARVLEGRYRPYPLLKIVVEKGPGAGKRVRHARPLLEGTGQEAERGEVSQGPQELSRVSTSKMAGESACPTTAQEPVIKTRTLLVPAVRDRVLQTAVARALSRSFEEEVLG